jgi:hypothetical protein
VAFSGKQRKAQLREARERRKARREYEANHGGSSDDNNDDNDDFGDDGHEDGGSVDNENVNHAADDATTVAAAGGGREAKRDGRATRNGGGVSSTDAARGAPAKTNRVAGRAVLRAMGTAGRGENDLATLILREDDAAVRARKKAGSRRVRMHASTAPAPLECPRDLTWLPHPERDAALVREAAAHSHDAAAAILHAEERRLFEAFVRSVYSYAGDSVSTSASAASTTLAGGGLQPGPFEHNLQVVAGVVLLAPESHSTFVFVSTAGWGGAGCAETSWTNHEPAMKNTAAAVATAATTTATTATTTTTTTTTTTSSTTATTTIVPFLACRCGGSCGACWSARTRWCWWRMCAPPPSTCRRACTKLWRCGAASRFWCCCPRRTWCRRQWRRGGPGTALIQYLFIYLFIAFFRSFFHSLIHSFIRSFICSFIHSCNHSLVHSFTHSFIHSLIHSFLHSFVH